MKSAAVDRELFDAWLGSVGAAAALEALTELCPEDEAFFAVDEKRRLVWFSPGAERLLGFSAREVLGQHCLTVNRCRTCRSGCGLSEHRTLRDVRIVLYRADGTPALLRKSARAFFDAKGEFLGGIEVLRLDSSVEPDASRPRQADARRLFGMVSRDGGMLAVFDTIENVAETDASVLLRGESGTGKELVARALHLSSHRRDGPFVAVNCAALTPSLVESELFGHVKGAFTGAARDRRGLFRDADGGSVFLDEVAELPLDVQSKLLRVLEQREVTPVGASRPLPVDVRVISATHRSLREEVRRGRFREDLMYRLRVVPLFIPPLRERRKDVETLLWHFVDACNERGPRRVEQVAPEVMRALLDYPWPGNVRELRNVVEYAFAVGRSERLDLSDLPPELRAPLVTRPGPVIAPAPESDAEDEKARIERALSDSGGNVGVAARSLGMSRPTFWRRRKKLGI